MAGTGLHELIAEAFETACDPAGMGGFIRNTAHYFDAEQGAIVVWSRADQGLLLGIGHNLSRDRIQALFDDRNRPESVFWHLSRLTPGDTFVFPDEHRGSGTVVAGLVTDDDDNNCGMILLRNRENADFTLPEHETLQTLMSYFRRAIRRNLRFIKTANERKTAMSIIDNSPRAIIVFGQKLQPTIVNTEARKILEKSDGLSLSGDALVIDNERNRNLLHDYLRRVLANDEGALTGERLRLSIPSNAGNMPYQMVVYAMPSTPARAALNKDEALAVAIMYDPAGAAALRVDVLHVYYDLTHAEGRLASELYGGKSLPDASKVLGISINTARTQLRSIFRKVGVNSQAALLQQFAQSMKQSPSEPGPAADVIDIRSRKS